MDALGPREHAPELLAHERPPEAVRDGRELRPQELHDRDEVPAPPPGHRWAEQAQALNPSRLAEADLDRHPAAERVADQVGTLDSHGVHEPGYRPGEPGCVVWRAKRLGRRAEPGQVDRVD